MQDKPHIRYRVGYLGDWEHCEYFVQYEKALKRYRELSSMFDNVHLVKIQMFEEIIDDFEDIPIV